MSHSAVYAYHVTNCTDPRQQPNWSCLKTSQIDRYYNGVMADLITEGVYLSTTLRDGDLPQYTLYPTAGRSNDLHWRALVPLSRFNNYRIIPCHSVITTNGVEQFALLLVPPGDPNLNQRVDQAIWEQGVVELTGEVNDHLCRNETTKKWRTNSYMHKNLKAWVNIVVPHEILLGVDTKWDIVEHM